MQRLLQTYGTVRLLGLPLADASLEEVAAALDARPGSDGFSYVVTPNADHFVRLEWHRERLIDYYDCAGALLLDSRVVRRLGRVIGLRMPAVTTGSDLTQMLFEHRIRPDEPVTIVGTTVEAVASLTRKFSLTNVNHLAPPFGFERDPAVVEECVRYVVAHPARFVFLACGAPRQELLAHRLVQAGGATGIGLCIGAAIDQIGGLERRAPAWVRNGGLEWFWRITREPKRMGRRYLEDLAVIPMLIRERFLAQRVPAK